jgi:diguanylate cyclase (GGDEF)-like protein
MRKFTTGRHPLQAVLFTCGMLLAALVSAQIAFPGGAFPVLWLPSGLLAAALLAAHEQRWPVFLLGSAAAMLAYGLLVGLRLEESSLLFLSSAVEALTGAWLVRRAGGSGRRMESPTRIFRLILFSAFLGTALGALLHAGLANLLWEGPPLLARWKAEWIARGLGVLSAAPLALAWKGQPLRLNQVSASITAERALGAAGLVAASFYIFADSFGLNPRHYLLVPFLVWAALRSGLRGMTAAGVVVTLVSTWGTTHQMWGYGIGETAIAALQEELGGFLAVTLTTSMLLAAVWDQSARTRQALQESEARFHNIFHHSPIATFEVDFSSLKRRLDALRLHDGRACRSHFGQDPQQVEAFQQLIHILDANQAAAELYGFSNKEHLLEQAHILVTRRSVELCIEEMAAVVDRKTEFSTEAPCRLPDGSLRHHHIHWTAAPGSRHDYHRVIMTVEDTTERRQTEEHMRFLSTHDLLTGLFNRNFFEAELDRLQHSRLEPVNVMVVDVNGMKIINDTLGHAAGDDLLRRTAQVLRASFRREDVIARIGGDEFVVLFHGLVPIYEAIARVHSVLAAHNASFAAPALSLSIGAASGGKGESLLEMFKKADQQMYREKRRQRRARPDESSAS